MLGAFFGTQSGGANSKMQSSPHRGQRGGVHNVHVKGVMVSKVLRDPSFLLFPQPPLFDGCFLAPGT
jgi:hypothetical protein